MSFHHCCLREPILNSVGWPIKYHPVKDLGFWALDLACSSRSWISGLRLGNGVCRAGLTRFAVLRSLGYVLCVVRDRRLCRFRCGMLGDPKVYAAGRKP